MFTKTYIFDIDGTLADNDHRLQYITNYPKDYETFYEEMINDKPIKNVISLCKVLYSNDYKILLVTGRPENYRKLCKQWLAKYNIPYDDLLMRKENDFRKDDIVKKEIYDEYIKPYEVVVGVFEDRNRCVKMWRDLGLTCYQPKETE